jgi:hypothetical protein
LCLPLGGSTALSLVRESRVRSAFPASQFLSFRPQLDRAAALDATGELRPEEFRAEQLKVYDRLKKRLAAEPAVAGVTFGNGLPGMYFPLERVEAQRGSETPWLIDANIENDRVRTAVVDVDYFSTLQQPLSAGRQFNTADLHTKTVAIVNETMARNMGGNALGVRIRYASSAANQKPGPWYEVVGIVRDASVGGTPPDFVFTPASSADVSPLIVAVRVRGAAAAFAPQLRALAAEVEPGLRLYDVLTLDEVITRLARPAIQGTFAVVGITLLLMALAAAGLHSLMSVAVTRRTREIGIRLAIGASPRSVLRSLFGRAALQVGLGILLGNALIAPVMHALGQSELRASVLLPVMLVASAGMLLTAVIACSVPARRALRIAPTEAVKYVG